MDDLCCRTNNENACASCRTNNRLSTIALRRWLSASCRRPTWAACWPGGEEGNLQVTRQLRRITKRYMSQANSKGMLAKRCVLGRHWAPRHNITRS